MATTKTAPAEQTVELPSPAFAHTNPDTLREYLNLNDRKLQLQLRRDAIKRELDEIFAARAGVRAQKKDRVAALVEGTSYDPKDTFAWADEREKALDRERRDIMEAIPRLERLIGDTLSKIRRETAEALRAQHRTLARDVVFKVAAAAQASEAEAELRRSFRDGGVSVDSYLYPMLFMGFGSLRDSHSRVRLYLREARRLQFITLDELVTLVDPTGKRRKRILEEEPAK